MQLPQEAQPFIVEVVRPPTHEVTVVDVLVGALGLAGAIALSAIPLGLLMGYVLIRWNRRRQPDSTRVPHISPSLQSDEPTDPPSSQSQ